LNTSTYIQLAANGLKADFVASGSQRDDISVSDFDIETDDGICGGKNRLIFADEVDTPVTRPRSECGTT